MTRGYVWAMLLVAGCAPAIETPTPNTGRAAPSASSSAPASSASSTTLANDDGPPVSGPRVTVTELLIGKGEVAHTGMTVRVHYVGRLADGTVFDSSVERGEAFAFTLGKGEVIRGWDDGVVGMRVGGKRKLVIPSGLAYGDAGAPPKIPGKATLTFEVELLGIVPKGSS